MVAGCSLTVSAAIFVKCLTFNCTYIISKKPLTFSPNCVNQLFSLYSNSSHNMRNLKEPPLINETPYRTQVLDRAVSILELLSEERPGLTLAEITERIGLNTSTVHRLLQVLGQHRLVSKNPYNGRYR